MWSHLGSLERILKAGLVSDSFSLFTGLAFSCSRQPTKFGISGHTRVLVDTQGVPQERDAIFDLLGFFLLMHEGFPDEGPAPERLKSG